MKDVKDVKGVKEMKKRPHEESGRGWGPAN